MKFRKFSIVLSKIFAAILILALCASIFGCNVGTLSEDEARDILNDLLPRARALMALTIGCEMPIIDENEENKSDLYRSVTSNAPYQSVDALKADIEEIYSKKFCEDVLYIRLFTNTSEIVGSDAGSGARATFFDKNGVLAMKVDEEPLNLRYEINTNNLSIMKGNRVRMQLRVASVISEGDEESEYIVVIVKEKNAVGELVWKLDSYTW